jgi:hypothetical protein
MVPRSLAVLAVAAMLLLAGCGALSSSQEAPTEQPPVTESPTESTVTDTESAATDSAATTAETTETAATETPDTDAAADVEWVEWNASLPAALPPGVNESGVDADALLVAHEESLADTGFVVTWNTTERSGDASQSTSGGVHARVTADRSEALLRYVTGGPDRQVYLTDERLFVRTVRDDETAVRSGERTPNASSVPDDFRFDDDVATFVENAAHEPVGSVVRDGRTLVVLEADAEDARGLFGPEGELDGDVTALRSQVLVAPNGTVVEHRALLTVTEPGGDATTTTYRYTVETGTVTVERPAWATEE